MLRTFFRIAIAGIIFQSSFCADKRSNSPSYFSTRPTTLLQYITCIEIPFFSGMLMPLGIFNNPIPLDKEGLQAIPVIASGCSFALANTEWIKALIYSSRHGSELSSFYRTTPRNACYEIAITLRTQSINPEKDAPLDYRTTIVSTAQTLQNKKPTELIRETTTFIETWIEQHQKDNERTIIDVTPCVITNRGKSINLKSISLIWNKRIGIEQELRKCFFILGPTHTDKMYEKSIFSLFFLAIGALYKHISHRSI